MNPTERETRIPFARRLLEKAVGFVSAPASARPLAVFAPAGSDHG